MGSLQVLHDGGGERSLAANASQLNEKVSPHLLHKGHSKNCAISPRNLLSSSFSLSTHASTSDTALWMLSSA